MALVGSALQGMMIGQCAANGLLGSKIPDFCGALSEGLVEGFVQQNNVTTIDTGLLPAGVPGVGTGKMSGITDSGMLGLTVPLLSGGGILGVSSVPLAKAITTATAQYFLAANLASTNHPLVAIGAGVGKILGLTGPAITAIAMQKMAAKGFSGTVLYNLVNAVCTGFATHILATGIVNVVIVGAPLLILGAPVPSGGPGTGNIT